MALVEKPGSRNPVSGRVLVGTLVFGVDGIGRETGFLAETGFLGGGTQTPVVSAGDIILRHFS